LVGILTDPDIRLRVTRADAQTGVTVARDPSAYRPNAALAQRVRDRDRTCRFPGCAVAARRCDLDHVVPHPRGSTSEDNLVSLCRTHHGFKHHAGWSLVTDARGVCTWIAPTGRSHVTSPADVREQAA
ncbi:MAG: HNH endonuclease signature motif containing protein, partial [Humibacillus sp.]